MVAFLELVSKYGSEFIIIAGLVLFVFMMINGVVLSNSKSRIKENLKLDGSLYSLNMESQKMEELEDEKIVITPNTIRNFEAKFNEASSRHDLFAQCIPLFPLFGIFGTVAGLLIVMGDVNAIEDFQNIMNGVGTALETTLYGLLASIILKFFDVVFPSRIINDVEVLIDDFDKKLELARTFKKS